ALRRADLAVCTGASLEADWLPMLQERAANSRVATGGPGMFFAADAVETIDVPSSLDRGMGDVHAQGNPHVHLDPERLAHIAEALAGRLASIDPDGAAEYAATNARWQADWATRMAGWRERAAPLAGRRIAVQHSTFEYLWRWTGLRPVVDIEPLPGMPPTPAHLRRVLDRVRAEPPFAVVQTLYQDPQRGRWLAYRIERPLLALPSTVTPEGRSAALPGLFDELLDRLAGAAGDRPCWRMRGSLPRPWARACWRSWATCHWASRCCAGASSSSTWRSRSSPHSASSSLVTMPIVRPRWPRAWDSRWRQRCWRPGSNRVGHDNERRSSVCSTSAARPPRCSGPAAIRTAARPSPASSRAASSGRAGRTWRRSLWLPRPSPGSLGGPPGCSTVRAPSIPAPRYWRDSRCPCSDSTSCSPRWSCPPWRRAPPARRRSAWPWVSRGSPPVSRSPC